MGNRTAAILCIVGGILLFLQGVTGSIGFLDYLNLARDIPALQEYLWIIDLVLWITTLLALGGGLTVIGGAFLVSKDRIGTGKFVIGIGTGMSLIGLIIGLVQPIISGGIEVAFNLFMILTQMEGWSGVVLTIIGRQMAGKSE